MLMYSLCFKEAVYVASKKKFLLISLPHEYATTYSPLALRLRENSSPCSTAASMSATAASKVSTWSADMDKPLLLCLRSPLAST